MKKNIILIVFAFVSINILTAQQTISETEKLASLGKIYGFLKYYHPEVAKGKFDWDQEFIAHLPKVLKATDKESLSAVYIDWIESLGTLNPVKNAIQKKPILTTILIYLGYGIQTFIQTNILPN